MPKSATPAKDTKNPEQETPMESSSKNNLLSIKKLTSYRPKSYTPVLVVLLIVAAFLLGILITKVYYLENGVASGNTYAGPESAAPDQGPIIGEKVDLDVGHFPAEGDENAKVKIVEFADFRCPFCEQLYKETVPNIIKDYVDTGKAVFYFRQFAFLGDASVVAANAAECANEQGKFWEMHNWLYDNQPPESDTSMYTVDNLTQVAGTLGLNSGQFNQCLSSNKYNDNVNKDLEEGQAAGVSGTPTLFINGRSIVGAEPYSVIKAQIETALSE